MPFALATPGDKVKNDTPPITHRNFKGLEDHHAIVDMDITRDNALLEVNMKFDNYTCDVGLSGMWFSELC